MLIPRGSYRYEIRRSGATIAIEEVTLATDRLRGVRRSVDGANLHEVDAVIGPEGMVTRVAVRYSRGLFKRNAVYDAIEDGLHGSVSAVAGRNEVVVKLGRFKEIDADLVVFRALTLAHLRARGQLRWTGKVAVIDPNTLVASSLKQSARARTESGLSWSYEARMGDVEEIELDAQGRIVRLRDSGAVEKLLADFTGPPAVGE